MGPITYQLIAGERRVQAARMAGIARMPVVIREAADQALLELALVENLQRQDLNPLEEAQAFRKLVDDFGQTHEMVGQRVGRSRTSVSNTLRLLGLEDDIRTSLASGQISEGHARALLQIDDTMARLDVWRRIVADELSVRDAETIARAVRSVSETPRSKPSTKTRRDPLLVRIEDDLRHALGTAVSVRRGRGGGSITIRFHGDEQLEALIERLKQPHA
jgi:ParB family chromosome partitioning protein